MAHQGTHGLGIEFFGHFPMSLYSQLPSSKAGNLTRIDSEQSTGSDTEVLAERTSCSFGPHPDLPAGGSLPQPPPTSSMEEIQVELQCADLWKRFHDIGTEMIITKAGSSNPKLHLCINQI
ncbi:UNVERIFIED_CONTAM: hypothetical protein K2H54_020474 [Gekko kuhli]